MPRFYAPGPARRGHGAMLWPAFIPRPYSVAPILLRLLLCLCLVVDTTAGAWAATGMAMPAAPRANAEAMPCHDGSAAMAATAAMHGRHAADPHPGPVGCKAGDCQCLQHCNAALALPAALPAPAFGDAAPNWMPHAGRGDPSPYRPVRPPIA